MNVSLVQAEATLREAGYDVVSPRERTELRALLDKMSRLQRSPPAETSVQDALSTWKQRLSQGAEPEPKSGCTAQVEGGKVVVEATGVYVLVRNPLTRDQAIQLIETLRTAVFRLT